MRLTSANMAHMNLRAITPFALIVAVLLAAAAAALASGAGADLVPRPAAALRSL